MTCILVSLTLLQESVKNPGLYQTCYCSFITNVITYSFMYPHISFLHDLLEVGEVGVCFKVNNNLFYLCDTTG